MRRARLDSHFGVKVSRGGEKCGLGVVFDVSNTQGGVVQANEQIITDLMADPGSSPLHTIQTVRL